MKKISILVALLLLLVGCSNRRAIAYNEYHKVETTKLSSVYGKVSKKNLIEARKRRAKYLKLHPNAL